jgi:hypothetical protein
MLCAGELRPLKPPKGVTLTAEQQKMLDEANMWVGKAYALLMEKHDPGEAVAELRKAMTIVNKLELLKGDEPQLAGIAEGNEKGTPKDKIEHVGAIEKIVEIGAAMGISAPDEVDLGLHKRKLVSEAQNTVKKIDAEQKQITQQLATMANSGGGEEKPQQAAQQPPPPAQQGQGAEQPNSAAAPPSQGAEQNAQKPENPAQALAAKQENVAQELNKLASKLQEIGKETGADKASQSFRKAAAEATKTADMIRENQTQSAAAASKQTERAIQAAMHEAGLADASALEAAIAAVGKQLAQMQGQQQKIQSKTQEIEKGADGRQASEETKQQRATALAIEEGKLKTQVEDAQQALTELSAAASSGNPTTRTAESAARSELASAAAEMQKNRPKQNVVNAAMKLAQGDAQAAAQAMAKVQTALDAAQQRVVAADGALAAGEASRLEAAYRAVQQLAATTRRLEQNALAAAGKPQPADSTKPEEKKNTAEAKPEPKNDGAQPGQVSASWGQVLNNTAEQIHGEAQRMAKRLANLTPQSSSQLGQTASGKVEGFERNFTGSLQQVRAVLRALEKVEQELGAKVAKEKENKALRNYRKEEIPRAYREAVAAYYEDLSKSEEKK